MKTNKKKSFLAGIPSWGLALLTMFSAFFILMVVGDLLVGIFKIPEESDAAEWMFYGLYNLIIAVGCYYICRRDHKSILYVPVLSNLMGIFSAVVERNFWISSLWIVICGGWVLSIIASLIGAWRGRQVAITSTP